MKQKTIFIFLLLYASTSFAQQRILKGVVQDSLHEPLMYANVMARPLNKDLPFVFSLTNSKGVFDLRLAKKTAYTVTVSYMGFHNFSFKIDSLSTKMNKIIILKENLQLLDEVIVTSKTPMKVTKDSIVYDVDKFVTGREFKLKSVMKKLPGIVINKRGDITIMGEKVAQIFVDNKPFFGGSTKLALDNLPANVIAKIQVIKDYNQVAFMKGLTDNQKLIINIQLKKGKKHFVFGDIEAGSDIESNYLSKVNVFYYAPKTNLSYIGNTNNIGENSLSSSDIRRFEPIKLSGSTGIERMRGASLRSLISDQDFLNKKVLFNALQWQQDVGSKWEFNLFAVNTQKEIAYKDILNKTYTSNPNDVEQIATREDALKKLLFAKLTVNYKPVITQYFNYSLLLNDNSIDTNKNIVNDYLSNQKNIDFNADDTVFALNQNLDWYQKFNKKNIVKLTTRLVVDTKTFDKFWLADNPILENLMPIVPYVYYDIQQKQKLTNSCFDFLLKHYYKLNAKNHLYFSLGNNYDKATFWNDINQQTNTTVNYTNFNSDFNLTTNDFYLGLQYRFKLWKSLCTPGVYLHQVTVDNSFTNQKSKQQLFLPKFDFELDTFGKLKLNYQMSLALPDVQKYSYNYTVQSFNSLYKGNTNITNALYHKIRLYYSIGSLRYFFSFSANYSKNINAIKNTYQLDNADFYLTPINSEKVEDVFDVGMTFSRTIKKFRIVYSPIFSLSTTYDYVGADLYKTKNTFVMQRFEISSSRIKNIDFSVGLLHNYYKTVIAGASNDLQVNEWKPFASIDYGYKKFNFNMDYKLKFVKALENTNTTYHQMNLNLRYGNEDKPWAVSFNALNVFDVREMIAYSQNSYQSANKSTYLQGRIVLLKLHYRF